MESLGDLSEEEDKEHINRRCLQVQGNSLSVIFKKLSI